MASSDYLEPGLKDTHDLFSNMGNVISDQPKMAIVYIDDIVLISSDMHEMENLKQLMAKEFEIKGSWDIEVFLFWFIIFKLFSIIRNCEPKFSIILSSSVWV